MNVVVIAPHPDDESIGCGGTICLHHSRGDRVVAVYLSSGEEGLKTLSRDEAVRIREREAEAAAQVLGIAHLTFLRYPDLRVQDVIADVAVDVRRVLERESPALIYLPHEHESHPDHQAALPIVRAAVCPMDDAELTLLTYEVWTPLPDFYHVENITPVMSRKLEAIRCHRSQVEQLAYDRAALGLSLYRGVVAGACRYAEIFQTS